MLKGGYKQVLKEGLYEKQESINTAYDQLMVKNFN